jgi:hypothetical protein
MYYMSDTEDDPISPPHDAGQAHASTGVAVVTIEGAGVSITRQVDEATMSSIIALLFDRASAAPTSGAALRQHPQGEPTSTATAGQWDPELTLGEFLVETKASTFPQKICAAGYYLIKLRGAESFDRDGVRAALVQAHEDMPANFTRDFATAASTHLIAASEDEAGRYYVPTTGRKAVESQFQDMPRRRSARRTRRSTASVPNGEVE